MQFTSSDVQCLQVWLELTHRISATRQRQRLAMSTCVACHSGGLTGSILCENGECPVFFTRTATAKRLDTLLKARQRLDDW